MTSKLREITTSERSDKFESGDSGPRPVKTEDRRRRRERRRHEDRRAAMRFDLHRPQRRADEDRRSEDK